MLTCLKKMMKRRIVKPTATKTIPFHIVPFLQILYATVSFPDASCLFQWFNINLGPCDHGRHIVTSGYLCVCQSGPTTLRWSFYLTAKIVKRTGIRISEKFVLLEGLVSTKALFASNNSIQPTSKCF